MAAAFRDAAAEAEIGSLMRLVTEVRRFRSDQGLRPGQQVPAVLAGIEGTRLAPHEGSIRSLLRLTAPGDSFTATASVLAEGITVELDTAAGIDVAAERRRLDKDLAAARKEADQAGRKLGNESFLAKAPADVVAKTRERLEAAHADIERISGRLAALPARHGTGGRRIGGEGPGGRLSIQDELREAEGEILARRPEHAIEPTLERMAALVSVLGDPQRSYPVIHITGTNGKTSTARMIESLLRARGLRTGLFTSPHLSSIRERIVVDGQPVSAETFVSAYDELAPYLAMVDGQQDSQLSFFEVLTGMAFAIFADVPVDVAVVEVGLGGTWDATNIADGAVAVVTPVSLDHTAYLGGTVEEIATDKAGIIKPGAVAVLAQQPLPAAEALLRRVVTVGASVVREGLEFGVLDRDLAVGGQRLDLRGLRGDYTDIVLPLFGAYQASNAAVALAAVEAFAAGAPLAGQSAEQEADRADETAGWPPEDEGSESSAPADARLADLDDDTPAVPPARSAADDDDAAAGRWGRIWCGRGSRRSRRRDGSRWCGAARW